MRAYPTTFEGRPRIGRGLFSAVYEGPTYDAVTVLTVDYAKECMGLGWFPRHRLFPVLEGGDWHPELESVRVYTMKRYDPSRAVVSKLCKHDANLYRALRKLPCCFADDAGFDHWREQFLTLPDAFSDEREALVEAVEAMSNYGSDVMFEISPRNVAVEDGKLILLDCFFMASQCVAEKATSGRRVVRMA